MIKTDGTIDFTPELLTLIEQFLQEFEKIQGSSLSGLDRALIIAYTLQVMRCDLELVGKCLSKQKVFKHLPPEKVLEDCLKQVPEDLDRRYMEVQKALYDKGWLPLES